MFDKKADREALQDLIADAKAKLRRPYEPQKMANVMSQLMARRGYAQQQSSADHEDAWREVVGTALAGQTRAGSVKRGVWEIFVGNSTIVQELTFRKKELLGKLAARLPQSKIRDLKFRVGPTS